MPTQNLLRRHRLCAAIALALGSWLSVAGAQGAAVVPLSSLNGSNGFRLDGVASPDRSGRDVSDAGDINGDGIDDIVIGAYNASPNGLNRAGSSFVVFGRSASTASAINLSTLDGSNGFRLDGVESDNFSGRAVAGVGDINGDGIDDLIIGAYGAAPRGLTYAGSSYVVFGRSTGFAPVINLDTLNGRNGFRLDGVAAGDYSGSSVAAAGDVNNDGIDDLVIGARSADPNGTLSGSSYIVFGSRAGFASSIGLSTLNGTSGFRLDGIGEFDGSGRAVSAAGDINADGIDDLVIGAGFAGPNGAGSSYIVFGRNEPFASAINLSTLNGSNGFRLDGVANFDRSGWAVSGAGDVNGDGIDDLIIGAYTADPGDLNRAGSSYVVFGRTSSFAPSINLSTLNGSNGFRLDGVQATDYSGFAVSGAGDTNGDGIDDLIIAAYDANPNGLLRAGSTYLVFGRSTSFASVINLSTLNGSNGFRLDGVSARDYSGFAASAAGDVNGDGLKDLIIGAFRASPNSVLYAGSSYVVFGSDRTFCDGFEPGGCR